MAFVAIAIPSGEYWKAESGLAIALMAAHTVQRTSLAFLSRKSYCVADSRNFIVRTALDNSQVEVTHLLFVDPDLTFPADACLRLLAHDKDIVGGTYARKYEPHEMMGRFWPEAPRQGNEDGKFGLVQANGLPTGFLMIKMDVFRKIEDPWFYEEHTPVFTSEDYVFCKRARD